MLYEAAERLRLQPGHNIRGSPVQRIEESDARRVGSNVGMVRIKVSEGRKSFFFFKQKTAYEIIVRIWVAIRQQRPCRLPAAGCWIERSELEVRRRRARGARNQR